MLSGDAQLGSGSADRLEPTLLFSLAHGNHDTWAVWHHMLMAQPLVHILHQVVCLCVSAITRSDSVAVCTILSSWWHVEIGRRTLYTCMIMTCL